MFTREELIEKLPHLALAEPAHVEVVEYDQYEFEPPCSEQNIEVFFGSKSDFASGLHFWITTLQAQGWEGREAYLYPYAESGLCRRLTQGEFAGLVAEYSRSLRRPLPAFLLHLDGFESGLQMYAEWNDVAAVAELAVAYVAFYWSTTA